LKESVTTHTATPLILHANANYHDILLPVGLLKDDQGLEITPADRMMDMSVEVDYLDLPYAPIVQLTLA
jgi:hypothetical protein